MVTAKEIQLEVLTAQQALIAEAERIVSGKDDNERHVSELEALGFTGSSSALTAKMVKSKELDELVKWYGFEYPGLKFIPSEAMVNVCQKYGLAIGHVSRYMGEVPPWALKQIAANKHHIGTTEIFDEEKYQRAFDTEHSRLQKSGANGYLYHATNNWARGYGNGNGCMGWSGGPSPNAYPREHGMKTAPDLQIAAPRSEMRLSRNERVNEDGQIVEVPMNMDPIVCIEVKGGYIVLAAWGEEGQDPQVFNAPSN